MLPLDPDPDAAGDDAASLGYGSYLSNSYGSPTASYGNGGAASTVGGRSVADLLEQPLAAPDVYGAARAVGLRWARQQEREWYREQERLRPGACVCWESKRGQAGFCAAGRVCGGYCLATEWRHLFTPAEC